jgi:ribA/ribD-fused uncharacterized protein
MPKSSSFEDNDLHLFDDKSRFSNTAFTPFFSDGLEFKSITHFLEYHKTMLFKKQHMGKAALNSATPQQARTANADMTYDELKEWYTELEDTILKGLRAKFLQNPNLMDNLTRTKDSELVYCCDTDGYWGTGMNKLDSSKVQPRRWPGANKLGTMLMKIRTEQA